MDDDLPDLDDVKDPRTHHYGYAHQALPPLMLRQRPSPEDLRTLVGGGFFQAFWDQVGELVPDGERMSPVGLRAEYHQLDERGVALVQMPPVEAPVEAIFVAIVSRPVRWLWFLTRHEIRYLTLEQSVRIGEDGVFVEGGRTVLAEWTARGHDNYGDGPEPTIEAFLDAVRGLL